MLVQVSGGSEDMLNPGLNIMGGMQPRGPRESMPDIPDECDVAAGLSIDIVDDGWDSSELIEGPMVMSCISLRFNMSMLGMSDISDIDGMSGMAVDCSTVVLDCSGSIPSPGPDSRMLSGKHSTLPWPLAKMLSTHDGNAPVFRYLANITSESSCVQSFRSMFVDSRSAARRALASPSLRANFAKGRLRDAAGRMRSGPRIASL